MKAEYLSYFNETVSRVKHSVNFTIPIIHADHGQLKGHKKAFGCCHGYRNAAGWEAEKITIDEYFIEECYEAEVKGKWYIGKLIGCTLVEVICHEIAHIHEMRHGKKHRELARRLTGLVEAGRPHGLAQGGAA